MSTAGEVLFEKSKIAAGNTAADHLLSISSEFSVAGEVVIQKKTQPLVSSPGVSVEKVNQASISSTGIDVQEVPFIEVQSE